MRWQIKKTAPFPLEQAVVSFTPGARLAEGGQEFVVAVARRDVIAQYEQACALAGVHAGLVDLATFSIVNGVLASRAIPAGDWLLVHVTPSYTTLTVIRDGNVILFRNRGDDAEGTLADLVHQTAMYYEDRLQGGGFSRVMLAGGAAVPGGADALRRNLEERLGLTVEPVDPRAAAALSTASMRRRNCSTRWRRSWAFWCANGRPPERCCAPTFRRGRSITNALSASPSPVLCSSPLALTAFNAFADFVAQQRQ